MRELIEGVPGQVAVREYRALGPAGGTGRVEDQGRVRKRHADRGRNAPGLLLDCGLVPSAGPVLKVQNVHRGAAAGQCRCRDRFKLGSDHEHRRGAVVEHVGNLGRREARVQRDEDGPEGGSGEQRLERSDPIRPEVGDPVPGPGGQRCQGRGEGCAAIAQLPVGQLPAALGQGDGFGLHPGPSRGPGTQSVVGRLAVHAGSSPRARIALPFRISGRTWSLISRAAKSFIHRSGVSSG